MELWNVTSDLVPWIHEHYARRHAYRPWDDVKLLEITPEWVYGASGADDGEREDEEIDSHRVRFIGYAWEHLTGYYSVGDIPSTDIERAYAITRMED